MNFEATIRAAGLLPKRHIEPAEKIRRCATETNPAGDSGWYILHPDGRGYWGDWSTGSGAAMGSWRDDQGAERAIDPKVVADAERQRAAEAAAKAESRRHLRRFWTESEPLTGRHPYLDSKGLSLTGCSGIRFTRPGYRMALQGKTHSIPANSLVIPVMSGNSIMSIQAITADGDKLFWKAAPVHAGAYILERADAPITVLAEGFATGLAVYQSAPRCRVVVAFNCGNFLPVVRRLHPTGSMVIAADNDWRTEIRRGFNPGLDKAQEVADEIGCGVAYPQGIEGSDWCDALKQWGERASKLIERQLMAKAKYVASAA